MEELVLNLGKLFIGFLGMLGPAVLLMAFLSVRDHRESILYGKVLNELKSPDLRGLYAVKITCGPFRRDTVTVDLCCCSKERIWDVMEQLSAKLPPRVRCTVNGITDSRSRSTWTLTVNGSYPAVSYCPCGR